MAKYLKLFETHAEYEQYVSGDFEKPNVSHCEDQGDVHYNPIETRAIITYKVTSTSNPTNICSSNYLSQVSKMWIDDVEQKNIVASYIFDTTGEHTVKYEFVDQRYVPARLFFTMTAIKKVELPNNIIGVGQSAFYYCTNLQTVTFGDSFETPSPECFSYCSAITEITLPETVTAIGYQAFYRCTGITSFTILATTPPELSLNNQTFYGTTFPIYVPAESVNAYKAASRWDAWASRIQAIPTA